MKVREFKNKISKGLGSVILFLKANPQKAYKYYNAILWACCHNTKYDSQCESARGQYLYEIICLSNRKEQLENALLEKLLYCEKYWDIDQLFEIAIIMHENGNTKANEAMYKKFKSYINELQYIKLHNRYSLELATAGATSIVYIDKLKGLEFVVNVMGSIMISTQKEEIFDTDWVIAYAEDILGEKEVKDFFDKKSVINENIKVFFKNYKSHILGRKAYQKNLKHETPNFATIINKENEYCREGKLNFTQRNVLRIFGKKTNKNDLIKVAKELENTDNDIKRILLLSIFLNVAYPLPIDFLIKLAYNQNKNVVLSVISVLKNIVDKRIHQLFLDLIEDTEIYDEALELLVLNFDDDYDIILSILKRKNELPNKYSEFDFHGLTMVVRDIFKHIKSARSLEIMVYSYFNTTCSFCRMNIIEIMCKNNIIPKNILEECKYDCVDESRNIVKKYHRNYI